MPENIATLGFEFDSKSTHKKLSDLIEKFNDLESKGKSTKQVLKEVFGGELPGVSESLTRINKLNASFKITGENIKGIGKAIGGINRSLNNLNLKALNPLPSNVAQNVERNAERLITSLNKVGGKVQEALTQINISPINPVSEDAVRRVERMAKALALIKPVTVLKEDQLNKLERIEKTLGRINAAKMPSPDAGKMGKAVSHVKAVNDELSVMSIHADAGMVAINGLTNSLTGKFFVDAIKNVTTLGQELAMIRSIAEDFDTSVIYEGLQAFPSILGASSDNARALYEADSSGIKGTERQLLDFTKKTGMLAKTIRADTQTTMDAITTTINAYGLSIDDAAYVTDIFFTIVKEGKANGQQLASGLGQVVSTARTAGLTLEEMGASITVLSKIMQSRNAITYFNNMLSKLINPTKAAADAARKHGIELGLTEVKAKGYMNVMRELYAAAQKDQTLMLEIFGDARGQRAALQLLGEGYADLQTQMDNFSNSAGAMEEAFEKISGDRYHQIAALPGTFQKISEAAGKSATDILTLGGALDPLLEAFNNMSPAMLKTVSTLTLVAGAYTGYKAIMLTIISYQAMMAKNEEILASKKLASQSAEARSMVASQQAAAIKTREASASYKAAQAEASEALAAKQVAATKHQEAQARLHNLKNQHLEIAAFYDKAMLDKNAIAISTQGNAVKQAEIKLREANAAAINAETLAVEAKRKADIASAKASQIAAKDSVSRFSNMLGPRAGMTKTAQADVMLKAQAAKASAYNAAAMRQEAIAAGDLTRANQLQREALRQMTLRKKYVTLASQLRTMRIKAATFAQKAQNATNQLAVFWNKALAVAVKAGAVAWKVFRVAVIAANTAMTSLWAKVWPMLAAMVALHMAMAVWEDLDIGGSKAAEKRQEAEMETDRILEQSLRKHDMRLNSIRQEADEMKKMADVMLQINNNATLTPVEFKRAASMATRLNDYLGQNLITINKTNRLISVQGDLLDAINKKSIEDEKAVRKAKYATLYQRYKNVLEAQNQIYRSGINHLNVKEYQQNERKLKELRAELKAYALEERALQNSVKNAQDVARIKKAQAVLEAEQKIAEFRQQQAMKGMNEEQRIAEYNKQISETETQLKKIADALKKNKLTATATETLLKQQLDTEKKLAELEEKRADAAKKIAEAQAKAQKEIAEAQKEIDDFRSASAYDQMSVGEKMLKNQARLVQLQEELAAEEKYEKAKKEFEEINTFEKFVADPNRKLKMRRDLSRRFYDEMGFKDLPSPDDIFSTIDNPYSKAAGRAYFNYLEKSAALGRKLRNEGKSQKEIDSAIDKFYGEFQPVFDKLHEKSAEFFSKALDFYRGKEKEYYEEYVNKMRPAGVTPMDDLERKQKELEVLKLQQTQLELIKEKEKEIADVLKKRREQEERLAENIRKLEEKRFQNTLNFAANDYQRMRIWKHETALQRQRLDEDMQSGQIDSANESFWKYYNAMEQQLSLQRKLADAERNANAEMVKLITSMDKFKATTVEAVNANSIQALELRSRQFNKMPDFKAETSQQSLQQQQEKRLQSLLKIWDGQLKIIQTDMEKQNIADEARWKTLIQDMKKANDNGVETLNKSLETIDQTLKSGIKVTMDKSAINFDIVEFN